MKNTDKPMAKLGPVVEKEINRDEALREFRRQTFSDEFPIEVIDGNLLGRIYGQDGTFTALPLRDTPENRKMIQWLRMSDRYCGSGIVDKFPETFAAVRGTVDPDLEL